MFKTLHSYGNLSGFIKISLIAWRAPLNKMMNNSLKRNNLKMPNNNWIKTYNNLKKILFKIMILNNMRKKIIVK